MYDYYNITSSSIKIREIIEEEINANPELGFIEDNLFFMKVDANPLYYSFANYLNLFIVILTIPIFLSIKIVPYDVYVFFMSIPLVLILIIVLYHFLCNHYLIYDLNKNLFYSSSILFNGKPLSILDSNYVEAQEIKKIILDINYFNTGRNSFLCDKFIVLLKNNTEEELTTIMPSLKYHEISMERGILFSKCFNVDFSVRGNLKAYEDMKENQKISNELLPIFFIMVIIASLVIFFIMTLK